MNQELLKELDDLDSDQEEDLHDSEQEGDNQKVNEEQIQKLFNQEQISQLLKNQDFLKLIKTVEDLIGTKIEAKDIKASFTKDRKQEATVIHQCNQYAAEIDRQINFIIKFVRKGYNKRLPELESIVTNPSLYCKALLQIQQGQLNTAKKSHLEEEPEGKKPFRYLSPQQSISLRIAISSPHQPLLESQKSKVLAAAKAVTLLHEHHNLLMIYLESCMQLVAPNLCKLVGSAIASKLISCAGGIDRLAMMPACNIQVMGGTRSANIGLSMMERNHTGIFGQMDIVKNSPKKFQMQLVRMLATNTAKCARADFLGTTTGIQGDKLRDQMLQRFQKVQQQGGLMSLEKPLPIPDQAPKKKRGGKRYRKMKEQMQMSELSKHKNRVKFGEAQEQIGDGVGLGMLKSGIGKLNVKIKKQNLNVSKKTQQRMNNQKRLGSGIESTLDFAGNQGIELVNPSAIKEQQERRGTESYFSREAGFKTILNQKMGK